MEFFDSQSSETLSLGENDNFTDLIRREVNRNLRRIEQEKKQHLVLKKYVSTFTEEIRCMMYTFGDVPDPLNESVLLIGTILRDQMNMLLIQATAASPVQKGNLLTHENVLLLLLHNKRKLKRLLLYLKLRDAKDCIFKKKYQQVAGEEERQSDTVANPPDSMSVSETTSHILKLVDAPEHGKRIRTCFEFLRKIDGSIDLVSIIDNSVQDPITTKRHKRRYLMTYNMNDPEYLEYARKLQASFYPKGGAKLFKKWLLADKVTHLVPTELALEMINYLAYETIAEIVEVSLRLKYEQNSGKPMQIEACDLNLPSKAANDENSKFSALQENVHNIRDLNSMSYNTDNETGNPSKTTSSNPLFGAEGQTANKLKENLPDKEFCAVLNSNENPEHTLSERSVATQGERIIENSDYESHFGTDITDVESLMAIFGNEFKVGILKKPITPDDIKEALNYSSGIYQHQYNVHWRTAKKPCLLCIQ